MNTKTYKWSGINLQGSKINGTSQAINSNSLRNKLRKENILPLKITPVWQNFWQPHKITKKDIFYIIEQLSVLIGANISIVKAFSIIHEETKNQKIKLLIANCKNSLAEGNSLHQTLKQHTKYFSDLICNLIKVGELSGNLDVMLSELAKHLKKTTEQKSKTIRALLYPITVLITALVVSTIFMVFVMPQFESMFESFGAELPTYTKLIINFSNFLQKNWQTLLTLLLTTIISTKTLHKHSQKFRRHIEKLNLNIPIIKEILTYSTISRLSKTLYLTLKAGIPITEALKIASQTTSNWHYQQAIKKTIKIVENGKPLNNALLKQSLFPKKVIQLIALGEETGKLETMLEKISDIYSERLNCTIENINKLLEPLIMSFLGIIVGGLVIGLYLPMFRLGAAI